MFNLLKNKNRITYNEIVPLISDVTGRSEEWVHQQSCIVDGKLPKENWLSTNELRDIWLASNKDTAAEDLIYRDDRYIMESLISYLFWSRDYINRIRRVSPMLQRVTTNNGIFNQIETLVDFGGGIGLSSLHLQQLFDSLGFNIQVVYHNVTSATKQNEIALRILEGSRVKICIQDTIPDGDSFFMSEVLEHIKAPVNFLVTLLNKGDKKLVFHASSFTLPDQPGHFDVYDKSINASGDLVNGRNITKPVNDVFFNRGYKNLKHIYFWNNRPSTFIKSEFLLEETRTKQYKLPRY